MTELDTLWRNRSDEQVRAALDSIGDYSDDARTILLEEQARRGIVLPTAAERPVGDVAGVARMHRLLVGLVAAQWLSLAYVLLTDGPFRPLAGLLMVGAVAPVRIVSGRLLALVDADTRLLTLASIPLFGLLLVVKFPSIAAGWAKRHGVEVGLSGPRN